MATILATYRHWARLFEHCVAIDQTNDFTPPTPPPQFLNQTFIESKAFSASLIYGTAGTVCALVGIGTRNPRNYKTRTTER